MIQAKYTIVLKTLMDDPQSKVMIDAALSTYPLYDPKNEEKFSMLVTRDEINEKLLNHYKYREIGFETFGRFLDELEITMNEIMPYYNQLLCTQDVMNGLNDLFENVDMTLQFDETVTDQNTVDITSSQKTTSDGSESTNMTDNTKSEGQSNTSAQDSSTNNVNMNASSKNVSSETPQSELGITAENIDNVSYADKVDWNKSNSGSESTTSGNSSSTGQTSNETDRTATSTNTKELETDVSETSKNTGSGTKTTTNTLTRKGNQGVNTYAHDMLEFRELLLNVVEKIIEDPKIQQLFMGVY